MSRLARRRVLDAVPPVGVVALGVANLLWGDGYRGSDVGNAAFLVASAAPLLVRRRHPVAVLAAVFALQGIWVTAYYRGAGQPPFEPFLAGIIACFALGFHGDSRALRRGAIVFVCVVAASAVSLATGGTAVGDGVPALIWWAAAAGIGRVLHERQALVDLLGDRAARLERERERDIAQAAMEERTRIARELHDVIAHSVSLMVVQATAERHLLGPEEARTAEALTTIEFAGREALGELRRLLGVLRARRDSDRLAPQPGLGALPELVEDNRRAGQEIRLVVDGEPVRLPPGLDLAAYRIVQEALTNARKHAGAAATTIALRWRPSELEIDVVDEGGAAAVPVNGSGHGLIGMRERASLYGGTVDTGALPAGGFRVRARLPIDQVASA